VGSGSDKKVMDETSALLSEFGVSHRIEVASAHRSPDRVRDLVKEAEESGCKVFIAGAGWAVASLTVKPVIGVPLPSSPLDGLDSLLSTAQMPAGVPVATVAIGEGGAKNAALLAVSILALTNDDLGGKLKEFRENMANNTF